MHKDPASYLQSRTKLDETNEFYVKDAFPAIKLLPVTAKCPPPPFAMLVDWRKHTCKLIYDISIGFQLQLVGWGLSTQNLLQNAKCLMSFVRDCRLSRFHSNSWG